MQLSLSSSVQVHTGSLRALSSNATPNPTPRQEHSIRKEETKRKRERSNKKERCVDEREREKRQKRRRDVLLNVNPYSLFPPQGGGGEAEGTHI